MDIIAEIRRRHFIENETITSLAEAFKDTAKNNFPELIQQIGDNKRLPNERLKASDRLRTNH
jgi:hypothetical protein